MQINKYLQILELKDVPDLDTLNRKFNSLVKESHPDLNRDNEEWAHNRTLDLIEASRELRKYIEQLGSNYEDSSWSSSFAQKKDNYSYDVSCSVSESSRPENLNSKPVAMQLLYGTCGNYAIPLTSIIRVVSGRFESIITDNFGKRICMHRGHRFNLLYPAGHYEPQDEFIVLVNLGDEFFGISFPVKMEFGDITTAHPRELIRISDTDSEFSCIMHREGQAYRILNF